MQTMPAKTRTAMTVGAILLGLVIVGAIALYSNNRAKAPTANKTGDPYAAQEMGTTLGDETVQTAPLTTAPATTANGITAPANTGAAANAGTAMTQPANGQSNATAAMSSTQVPATYVVAQGETLRDIAQKFYGDPVYSADIEKMNSIKDPDHIMAGTTLKLPRPESLHK